MADNLSITQGTGTVVAADQLPDGSYVQYVKLMDGTADGTAKGIIGANGLKVDPSGVTQPVSVISLPLPSGAATLAGQQAAQATFGAIIANKMVLYGSDGVAVDFTATSPVSLATAPALVASAATIGAVVSVPRATANGATSSRVVASTSSNTATNLKASAGNIARIDVFNVAAYDVFLKFYNKASAPTVGTDTPAWTIPVKAGTGYAREFPSGKSFATGISYGITKLQADSDTTALAASDLTGSIDWI